MPTGLRVLLVEDDAAVAAVARGFLEGASHQVATASSGAQALRVLESDATIDLLLSDVALGAGMRGTALAEAAQRLRPRLRVLLMTGYSAELPDAAAGPPMHGELLLKPFSREQLLAAIARVASATR
jgi:CheY-like chemotaxis protein